MPKYTTGEIAKLCGVSVRTVQYYDSRNILVPSELSEGGRRLYSEDDLKRMKIICFLRDAGISISSIAELLADENPESVISVLLEQQEQLLKEEMEDRKAKLALISGIQKELKKIKRNARRQHHDMHMLQLFLILHRICNTADRTDGKVIYFFQFFLDYLFLRVKKKVRKVDLKKSTFYFNLQLACL